MEVIQGNHSIPLPNQTQLVTNFPNITFFLILVSLLSGIHSPRPSMNEDFHREKKQDWTWNSRQQDFFFKPLDMYTKTGACQPCSLEVDFPCVEMPAWDAVAGLDHIIVIYCQEPPKNRHTSFKEYISWICVVRSVIYWQISHNLNCPKIPCVHSHDHNIIIRDCASPFHR